jgi:hypothetical protein
VKHIFLTSPPNISLQDRVKSHNFVTIQSFDVFFGEYKNIGYCKVLLTGLNDTTDSIVVFVTNTIAKEHNLKTEYFTDNSNEGFLVLYEGNYNLLPKLHEVYNKLKQTYPECDINVRHEQEAVELTILNSISKKP